MSASSVLQLTVSSAATAQCMSLIKGDFQNFKDDFKEQGKYPIRVCAGTREHVEYELKNHPPKLLVWCGAGEGCSPQKVNPAGTHVESLDLYSLLTLLAGAQLTSTPERVMVCLENGAGFAVEMIKKQGLSWLSGDVDDAVVAETIEDVYKPTSKSLLEKTIRAIQALEIKPLQHLKDSARWLHVKPFGTNRGHTNITTADEPKKLKESTAFGRSRPDPDADRQSRRTLDY